MKLLTRRPLLTLAAAGLLLCAGPMAAQDDYEIQVYAAETVPRGVTMVELHSNLTVRGAEAPSDVAVTSDHALHETLEITHGWTPWFETGFYLFSSASGGTGWEWVGSHIRPRVAAPGKWGLPVGLSLSMELGYQRRRYSPDTWTWEIRPIVDKQWNKWYVAFNPTLDRSFHGESVNSGVEFSPNVKLSYAFLRRISGGLEYYGSLGPVTGFVPLRNQGQQIVPTIDVDFGPEWEFNFGVGLGMTSSTSRLLAKMIIGRRFGGKN